MHLKKGMNKPLFLSNTTVLMLMNLGDLLEDWKVQLVLPSLYLIFSIVRTSGNNMDLATMVNIQGHFSFA